MSGLGLLATAFGSYASTLGGLYKEQVEKEQAAKEKLAAEEREFMRQLTLKDIDHEWERQKTAEDRKFAIDMLQRKFEQAVKLIDIEKTWEARNADIAHQRALERTGYEHELELKKQEELKRLGRRDALARLAMSLGVDKGGGDNKDPREFSAKARALTEQLRDIGERIDSARPEEKPGWIAQYNATKRALDYLLEYGEIPKGLGNAGGTPFRDPNDIVNWLANE